MSQTSKLGSNNILRFKKYEKMLFTIIIIVKHYRLLTLDIMKYKSLLMYFVENIE